MNRQRNGLIACTVILLALTSIYIGCDGPSGEEMEPSAEVEPSAGSLGLSVELDIESDAVAGQPFTMGLRLRNLSSETATFYIQGFPENGFAGSVNWVVADEDGNEVWSWAERHEGLAEDSAAEVVLDAGDETALSYEWDGLDNEGQIVSPGKYVVSAVLIGHTHQNEDFTIPAEGKEILIAD